MKLNMWVIRIVLIVVMMVFLLGFSRQRNNKRNLEKISIEFIDENEPFITHDAVNKLLIQNVDSVTSIVKETLVLNEMEQRLLGNPMIRDAEVFVTVDGALGARIEQRNPIARVADSPDYYLDEDGKKMPLSAVYTARVPLITGKSQSDLTEVTELLLEIEKDDFMKSSVVGLHIENNGNIILRLRKHDLKVRFGKPKDIARKFQNLKAFYKKTKQDNLINNYDLIDLQFGNQVVATKK
jgi:cell division protein FtsQ